jgi:DNA-directed RNA polymerase beta subunit
MTTEDSLRHITSSVAFMSPLNIDKELASKKKREFTIDVLNNDLFPHCHSLEQKLYLVGYMAKKLIETCKGWRAPDDRDSYVNKRIELTGTLLNNLFRNYFNKLVKEMQKLVVREINGRASRSTQDYENIINMTNIYKLVKSATIENGINRALSTGDFSIKQANSSKVGVGQVLNRLTYPATLSHLRRINTPLEKSGELIAPRKLHNTTFGFCCCVTGDTDILMANRDIKKIKDLKNGDNVMTIHRETLHDEPSEIYNFFSIMPDKLFELTTKNGLIINATADHPFLIKRGSVNEMINLENLRKGNLIYIYNKNGCICVEIESITEIEPEPVYDFTTRSENHSFIANSFVVSNCVETPEGQSIGIVKNLAYMAHITIPTNSSTLYDYILPQIHKIEDVDAKFLNGKVKVFINGSWMGVTTNPMALYQDMKEKKYSGIINIYTSVVFDFKTMEIRVCSDGGRLTRPLLRVKDNRALVTLDIMEKIRNKELGWNDLLTNFHTGDSIIEYIDVEEQGFAMIAMKDKNELTMRTEKYNYTHCEIHPSTIFGVLASCIPFPEHNQAPRNTYECLDIEEEVWMADGRKKAIKDVVVGDYVLTFHPQTLAITTTKVVRQFIIPEKTKRYKIKTVSGKEIIATADHKFMAKYWDKINDWMLVSAMIYFIKNYESNIEIGFFDEKTSQCHFVTVKSIEETEDGFVSDIEVESENHSFIAGSGFLSSNCAQLKQAIGVYALNFDQRMDKTAYVMAYPSRPLVDTRVMNFMNMHKAPSGCQIHVAIMTHTGYNQEDSLLINRGSIDRGMFMSTIYHTEKDEDKNIIRDEIIRCKPDKPKTKGIKFGNYEKLNNHGFIPENTLVENRDVIIAKIIPIKENRNDPTKVIKFEDQSKIYRTTEESYIDKNYMGRNGDGYNFAKTRVRILRKPVIGDKFSSRFGQKGTCGNIIPECDMPFNKDGIRPDLILNPHAIPSRMTIGQLKETILGKVLIELGFMGDGTAFSSLDVSTISQQLQNLGYHSQGNEVLYSGLTGEQLEVSTFFGPVYYQRLKHMVNDKQHSRAFGPMVNLTRQPAEGRARDGGFRVGEMERDVLLAHGMSRFTKERLFDVSDAYSVFVCKCCGMIASYNNGDNKRINKLNDNFTIHFCKTCNNMTQFAMVEVPYAFKLMSQELQTINVVPRILTE